MKKSIFIAVGIAAALVCGCNADKELKTEFYEKDVSAALMEGVTDSIKISISLEYPVGGASKSVLDMMTKTIIGKSMDSDDRDIASAVDKYIQTTVSNYRDANDSLYSEMADTPVFSWEDELHGYFSGRYDDIVSYTLNAYSFTGGAHGISGYYCINMNLKDGSIVTEKDLFNNGYEETLNALLTSHLHEALPDDREYESLWVKDIETNGNFRVTEDGVTYVYDPYELGPYYLGAIEVSIPWSELEDILKPLK